MGTGDGIKETQVTNAACDTCMMECNTARKKAEEDYRRANWWLEHSKKQTGKMWEQIGEHLGEKEQSIILEQLGRNCARNLGWAEQYKGDPEGFFAFMYQHSGEEIVYDKRAEIITVTTKERECDCRLVDTSNISPIYCNCSVGWQKYTYETILNKKVDVQVKESALRGSKRCVFVVTIIE